MACGLKAFVHLAAVITLLFKVICTNSSASVLILTEGNWTRMLDGIWFVKFYAPWCPACKSLAPTWEVVAQRNIELGIQVAEIDVTENAALSGRFLVTALPSIYYVKDGIFRQYRGSRGEKELVDLVQLDKWQEIEPVPWYQSPTSYHMAALGMFFKFSLAIRSVHTSMTSEYGIPVWCSYVLFAIATILFGLVVGLLIVCLCDSAQSRKSRPSVVKSDDNVGHSAEINDSESDVLDDREETPQNHAASGGGDVTDLRDNVTTRRRAPKESKE